MEEELTRKEEGGEREKGVQDEVAFVFGIVDRKSNTHWRGKGR